jgi:uncharacterized protein YndB with AHSA1/START domain
MATNISTITLNAAAAKVWDTLTNPEKVKLWQFGYMMNDYIMELPL